jgi:radical SAM protein with 4Fe4S-binding SPASM domain
MANKTGVSEQEYIDCEMGRSDLNFAFLYRCALAFGVDVGDIIEGSSPNLNSFTVTRKGEGQRIEEAHDMIYYNMAASFRNRIAEPLYVHAAYSAEAEKEDIKLTTHEGQECDIVIEGQLKVQVGEHTSVLNPGDYPNIRFSHCSTDLSNRPLTVNYKGEVRFCNHSPRVLGNIYDKTIGEIVSECQNDGYFDKVPEYCTTCNLWSRCRGGCRAASEQLFGTFDKADPILN